MKILILGGTGRTGKWLIEEAIKRNHMVHALVRDAANLPLRHPNLIPYTGSPDDLEELSEAMEDCEAILSTLNISRTSDFPWAKLRTPKNFLSEVAHHIIELAPQHNIKRVIVTSAYGTNETLPLIPWWFRWTIQNSNVGVAYKDHEKAENLFKQSSLDFTVIRPVGLTNSTTPKEVLITADLNVKHKLTISRMNTAITMLDILEQTTFIRQMPVVSEK
jgi:putative NADH-flavin reductase